MTPPQKRFLLACLLLLPMVFLAALAAGHGGLRVLGAFLDGDGAAAAILREIRLPRAVMAAAAGASLSGAGLVFQTVLRNPLSDPYILGVSGGSAIGVIAASLLGWSAVWQPALAFAGAVLAVAAILCAGMRKSGAELLLAGVMLNAFCGAVILFLISMLRSQELNTVLFWFLGDLGSASLAEALCLLAVTLAGGFVLHRLAPVLDVLLLGNDGARALGVNIPRSTALLLGTASLLTGACVAWAGPIGFVGLVVPQMLRLAFGVVHGFLLPASMLCGASFLILCDMGARSLPMLSGEIPIGAATALVGAPIFMAILFKGRNNA